MVFVRFVLIVMLALSISSMLSGFLIARRMGYYLMKQVMILFVGTIVSIIAAVLGYIFPPSPAGMFDILHLTIALHFVLFLVGLLMQLTQIMPVLLKTMQGAPIHSSHITNVILTTFVSLALLLTYVDLASITI
ncbi:MAG: hypothetical protein R6V83_12785 [Candidatus Thorarchaeota archaeon]